MSGEGRRGQRAAHRGRVIGPLSSVLLRRLWDPVYMSAQLPPQRQLGIYQRAPLPREMEREREREGDRDRERKIEREREIEKEIKR